MSEIDRGHLPVRRPAFSGVAKRTLEGSQPDWKLIAHPKPPDGAPAAQQKMAEESADGKG